MFLRGFVFKSARCNLSTTSPLKILGVRFFSEDFSKRRNIGISAHIDSGKTTLTERILFYSGRIHAIHDVRGKDDVGAKMDSMELEKEKGITIQSAATYTTWKDYEVNIIDTPGHVDFTIEVERALRVLDGAIMVLCGVSGVQSQSLTVDRQMRRYKVPRVTFINKLDRTGADPWRGIKAIRDQLGLNAAAVQIPIGLEAQFEGVIDLLDMKALYFDGGHGENVREEKIPDDMLEEAESKRNLLIEHVAECDEDIGELFLMEEDISIEQLKAAIRKQTIALKFVPVFMGSAFKNKAVQPLLDGVIDYLPDPTEVTNIGLDLSNDEAEVVLATDSSKPFVGLAFKLEEGKFGQLTYVRVYQGKIKKGDLIMDSVDQKKVKVPRVVRMHSNEMQDVEEVGSGEIAAMFGVDCVSGTTFVANKGKPISLTSIHVPEPVISQAIRPKHRGKGKDDTAFGKALARFVKEDPTFRLHFDNETSENIISGMGELHLDIYRERLFREYGVETVMGNPRVNYRETIAARGDFDYLHKKQSGGAGQYAKVIGYIEPLPEDSKVKHEFVNGLSGNNVPPDYVAAIEKGFLDAIHEGTLCGAPVEGVRFVILDGASHAVDSSELAFRTASTAAFRQAYKEANSQILEPVMTVEVEFPSEFQSGVVGGINRRKGVIESVTSMSGLYSTVSSQVALKEMFGYSTDLRSLTEGKGEYSMEYLTHNPVTKDDQNAIHKKHLEKRNKKSSEE